MSIAADFRDKWQVVVTSADNSIGKSDDERFALLAKAVEDAGLALVPRAMLAARLSAMKHSDSCPCTDCT